MRTARFTKRILDRKTKIWSTIIITVFFTVWSVFRITDAISRNLLDVAVKMVETQNALYFKTAYSEKYKVGIDTTKLLDVIKNGKGEILEVDFKIDECEKILMVIIEEMGKNTDSLMAQGYPLFVPLGYMTNNPLLVNLGPKIPVKIATTDVVMGSISTKIADFGLNNALVEIYMDIEITTNTAMPLNEKTTTKKYSALLASKIIAGTVPNFYNGTISKRTENIDIPINGD